MVKMIEPGKRKRKRLYKGTCRYCECIFEFDTEDVIVSKTVDHIFYEIVCPFCYTGVNVSDIIGIEKPLDDLRGKK